MVKTERVRKEKLIFPGWRLESEYQTSPRSWDKTSHHDLPLRTASRPERWLRLRIAVCSSTPPSATHWSEDRNAPRLKWHLHCTSPQLPVWEMCENGPKTWHTTTKMSFNQSIYISILLYLVREATDLQKVLLHNGWVSLAVFWGPASGASPVAAAGNS